MNVSKHLAWLATAFGYAAELTGGQKWCSSANAPAASVGIAGEDMRQGHFGCIGLKLPLGTKMKGI